MGILQRHINLYDEFTSTLKDIGWSEDRIANYLSDVDQKIKGNEQNIMTVDELEKEIKLCKACYGKDLVSEKGSIPGRGTRSNIDILFVGLMPGDIEEKTNKIFSGPNSNVLMTAMSDIGIGKANCPAYLHNLVCCKPLGDKPKVEQVKNCSLFLAELMWVLQPNLIVTLGTDALKFFLGKTAQIKDYEGEVLIEGRYIIVPLKHPSAIHRIPDDAQREVAMKKYKDQVASVYKVNTRIKKLRASGEIPQRELILASE